MGQNSFLKSWFWWVWFHIKISAISGRKFTSFFAECQTNCSRSSTGPILNIFICSKDIRRQSLKSTEIRPNFACFWPMKIFWGVSNEILDRNYKTEHSSKHHDKFCGDRLTELKDLKRKKKKCQQNISPLRNLSLPSGLKSAHATATLQQSITSQVIVKNS